MPATFKTFNIKFRLALEGLGSSADVALASLYGTWAIVLPTEPEEDSTVPRILYTLTTSVGVTVPQSTNKRHRFWMKNYSENEGVLEQLEALGIVRRTGDYHKQGFVNFPAVEICLEEPEIVHACGSHFEKNSVMDAKLEILGAKRHPWCSQCKQVYYCDAEVRLLLVNNLYREFEAYYDWV